MIAFLLECNIQCMHMKRTWVTREVLSVEHLIRPIPTLNLDLYK